MRIWNYGSWSFTHDELGALVFLNYDSISELIAHGVRDRDAHPAFVQVLLWVWTSAFGLSEAAVRLPFVIAGVFSVVLLYLIAKKWFGFTTACFSALSLSLLDFPILYSQLARPYSFGLLFSLLAVWCWTRFLFGSGNKIYLKATLYGIATALCMFTHYFSFFFAFIVALTGFLFLKKETWKPYILSGIIAIALFLPHISVTLYQLQMGGVGEWLAKPGKDFLWKYILYGFNNSTLVVITVTIISLLSVLVYHLDISFSPQGVLRTKLQAVCIAWFLIPFLAGYYYSVEINAVLQYSTLLFSFPFLLLFLFSFFPKGTPPRRGLLRSSERKHKTKFNSITYASLGVILLFSTVIEKNFYKREDFGVFKEINQAVVKLHNKYDSEKITTILNTSSKEIFDFYFQRNNETVKFDFYAGDDSSYVADMLAKIDECNTPYLIYGWSNFRSPYEIPEIIKRKYPCVIYDERHFNSQLTLFARGDTCKRDTIFFTNTGFESQAPLFTFDTTGIDTSLTHTGKHSLRIEPTNKYCITLRRTVKQLFKENSCVNVSAWVYTPGEFDAQLVIDIGQPTGKRDWHAKLLPKFIKTQGEWQQIFATFELPANAYPDDEVKIHLWNPGKNSFFLDDVTISSFADSKYDYYTPSFRK